MQSSPNGGPPRRVVVPVPLPDSWDYDKVLGRRDSSVDYKRTAGKAYTPLAPPPPPAPKPYPNGQTGQPTGTANSIGGGTRGRAPADKPAGVYAPPAKKEDRQASNNGP